MQFNWTNFFIAGAIWTTILFIALLLFPLIIQNTNSEYWNFETHSYKTEINWTAIIIIGITTIILFIWLVATPSTEKSKILHPRTILKSTQGRIQEILASHKVTHPIDFYHNHSLGNFSIGYLWLSAVWNKNKRLICMVLIGNDNYSETNLRQRFESPIISDSEEYYDIKSAKRYLTPKEKGTLESKIKNIYKELKGEGKEFASTIFKKAMEEAEETEEMEE